MPEGALERAVLLAEPVDVGLERAELPQGVEGRRRERGDRLEETPVPFVERGSRPPAGLPVEGDDDAEDPVPHDERRPGDAFRRGPEHRLVRPRERAARAAEVEDERVGRGGEGARERGKADRRDDGGAAVLLEDDAEAPLGVEEGDGPRHDLVDERLLLAQDVERPGDVVEGLEAEDLLAEVERLADAGVPDRHVSARRTPARRGAAPLDPRDHGERRREARVDGEDGTELLAGLVGPAERDEGVREPDAKAERPRVVREALRRRLLLLREELAQERTAAVEVSPRARDGGRGPRRLFSEPRASPSARDRPGTAGRRVSSASASSARPESARMTARDAIRS